jgi:hypothetical protein
MKDILLKEQLSLYKDASTEDIHVALIYIKIRLARQFGLNPKQSLEDIVCWIENNKGKTKQVFEGKCRSCGAVSTVAPGLNNPIYSDIMKKVNKDV